MYLSPGLIDTHIHGFRGYGTEDAVPDAILGMSRELGRYGVTSFCPTIYSMSESNMLAAIGACVQAMGREEGARIIGIHLEGPFISPQRPGVQKPGHIRPVDMEFMERLYATGAGHIVSMTVAPELKGMRELALYCIKKGILLQAGHTDATYENMVEGMQAGIRHSTHFFNAMSRLHQRNPGAVGAILIHPELSCEIIADGHHVHPDLVRLLVRDKPDSNIVLVTDSLKPTEQDDESLVANGEEVYLSDGLFHRRDDDVIAGSCLTMLAGVGNLVAFGLSVEVAVKMASANPARVLGLRRTGVLSPGYTADLVVFDRRFSPHVCMIGGRFIRRDP